MTRSLSDTYMFGHQGRAPVGWSTGYTDAERALICIAERQLETQEEATQEIINSNIESGNRIVEEIANQNSMLQSTIVECTVHTILSINKLEKKLCAELAEIQWQLTQVSGTLDAILTVLKHPRNTEAQELVRQGVRNFNQGKYPEARDRFLKAYELDNTDFQVLYNLGFIALHDEDAEHAIMYFQDASTLPDNITSTAKAQAMSSLARVHYVIDEYMEAFNISKRALEVEDEPKRIYQTGVYGLLAQAKDDVGLKLLQKSILRENSLFALAAGDPELEPFRHEIFTMLHLILMQQQSKNHKALENLIKQKDCMLSGFCNPEAREFLGTIENYVQRAEKTNMDAAYTRLLMVDNTNKEAQNITVDINQFDENMNMLTRSKELIELSEKESKTARAKAKYSSSLASLMSPLIIIACYVGTVYWISNGWTKDPVLSFFFPLIIPFMLLASIFEVITDGGFQMLGGALMMGLPLAVGILLVKGLLANRRKLSDRATSLKSKESMARKQHKSLSQKLREHKDILRSRCKALLEIL